MTINMPVNYTYVLLNVNSGNAPFLRGLEFLSELNKQSRESNTQFRAILPDIYSPRQKSFVEQDFPEELQQDKQFVLYDPLYGQIMKDILYLGGDYSTYLHSLKEKKTSIEQTLEEHFSQPIKVTDLSGETQIIEPRNISFVFSRNPIIALPSIPTYLVTIIPFPEILERAKQDNLISFDSNDIQELESLFENVYATARIEFVPEPSTTLLFQRKQHASKVVSIPPNIKKRKYTGTDTPHGLYVNVSGITHLQHNLVDSDLPLYSSFSKEYPQEYHRLPSVLACEGILAQVARAGWGSVWNSIIYETPFLYQPIPQGDDIEIYYNQQIVEKLGIGEEFTGTIELDHINQMKEQIKAYKQQLIDAYGTLDGNAIMAQEILKDISQ